MSTKFKISIVIGICFILGAFALGFSYYQAKKPSRTISVVGLAEKDFVSDLVVYQFSFRVKNMNLQAAYEELKRQTDVVKEKLQAMGVNTEEITFKSVKTSEDYEYHYDRNTYRENKIFTGYILTQSVRIESQAIEKIEELSVSMVDLINQGITIQANDLDYFYTKLDDLKIEMLDMASQNARLRAETIASGSGTQLSHIKSANMGVFQITAPNSSSEDYTWGGAFNTSSKRKRASINIRLTFYAK